jgi:hypothetical protein
VLISYFDASSKAFDYQSKNPGARAMRVANLTRKASLTNDLEKAGRAAPFGPHFLPMREAAQGASVITAFYNEAHRRQTCD